MKDIDLLAIGNPCADIVLTLDRLPAWDDKCAGRAVGTFAGGTEANVACAISRLGRRAACFGAVGSDSHGAMLRRAFEDDGVRTDFLLERAGGLSSSSVLFVSTRGERSLVWVPLTGDLPRDDLEAAVRRSRVAYCMPYALAALRQVRAAARGGDGTMVAIDVEREGARAVGGLTALLDESDIAFCNESGFIEATGCAPTQPLLRAIVERSTVQALVVTLGARGALAATRTATAAHPAFAAELVDATGAGDTFNAAFLHAWLDDRDLAAALAFACAAASRSVASTGARSGMPDRAAVEAVLARGRVNA